MTRDEAANIVGILVSADGFCSYCARKLLQRFSVVFSEFNDILDMAWAEKFSGTWRLNSEDD